jgi:hypothetical protein
MTAIGCAFLGSMFALQGACLIAGGFLVHGILWSQWWMLFPHSLVFGDRITCFVLAAPISGHGVLPDGPVTGYLAFLLLLGGMGYFAQTRLPPASSDPIETKVLHDESKGV